MPPCLALGGRGGRPECTAAAGGAASGAARPAPNQPSRRLFITSSMAGGEGERDGDGDTGGMKSIQAHCPGPGSSRRLRASPSAWPTARWRPVEASYASTYPIQSPTPMTARTSAGPSSRAGGWPGAARSWAGAAARRSPALSAGEGGAG
jgi:hypothetical protein